MVSIGIEFPLEGQTTDFWCHQETATAENLNQNKAVMAGLLVAAKHLCKQAVNSLLIRKDPYRQTLRCVSQNVLNFGKLAIKTNYYTHSHCLKYKFEKPQDSFLFSLCIIYNFPFNIEETNTYEMSLNLGFLKNSI